MSKKHIEFSVDFYTLINNKSEIITPEEKCEAVFTQSSIFVETILTAIYLLNFETQSIGKNALEIAQACEKLALIGLALNQETTKQFQEMRGIPEATKDDQSK